MMKQIGLTFLVSMLGLSPAIAQNVSDIAQVQAGQSCIECNLFQADLSYRHLPGVNVSRARLRQANLSLVTMNNANFSGANISVANLFGGRFTGARFSSADLTRSSLVGAYFSGADFTGARLDGANLSGAELEGAYGLTQSQLNTACGDASTQLPTGLSIRSCQQ